MPLPLATLTKAGTADMVPDTIMRGTPETLTTLTCRMLSEATGEVMLALPPPACDSRRYELVPM